VASRAALRGEHVAYFYQASDSLLDALCDFIGSAVGAGNGALIIATKVHANGLQRRLKARGLDTQKASQQRRYVALDASELLSRIMVNGMPDGGRFAENVGAPFARI
jgi:hypothetical protein